MKMTGRYAPGIYAGIGAIFALVAINALSIPRNIKQAQIEDKLKTEAQLEKTKAELTKEVAQSYSDNQIATFNQLIVSDYILGENPPMLDWKHTVDPTKKTFVYDKNRLCVGYAMSGKFYFVHYYQGVCNNGIK